MSDSVPPSPDQVFVSVSQAARLNGVSERAIRKRCASGKIPYAYRNNLGHWRLPMLVRRAEVTMKVAAEWAQVDPKTVRRWCQQSKIPGAFQTPNGHWRIKWHEQLFDHLCALRERRRENTVTRKHQAWNQYNEQVCSDSDAALMLQLIKDCDPENDVANSGYYKIDGEKFLISKKPTKIEPKTHEDSTARRK
jgi:hypothetical protein